MKIINAVGQNCPMPVIMAKREIKNGELVESSQLLSYIENKGDVEMQRNDWINTLK